MRTINPLRFRSRGGLNAAQRERFQPRSCASFIMEEVIRVVVPQTMMRRDNPVPYQTLPAGSLPAARWAIGGPHRTQE